MTFVGACATPTCAETATCARADVGDEASLPELPESPEADASATICDSVDANHAFCWDMSAYVDGGPDGFVASTVTDDAGVAELSASRFQSAPRAGRAVGDRFGPGLAYFQMTSQRAWKHVRFSSSLFLDSKTRTAELMWVGFATQGVYLHWFSLVSDLKGFTVFEYWYENDGILERTLEVPRPIPRDRWSRIAIDVELGAPGLIHVTLDGAEVASGVLGSASPLRPAGVRASAGIVSSSKGDHGPVFVDDMLLEEVP